MIDKPNTHKHWNPPGVAPPLGKYSNVNLVPAGTQLMFISGQVGNHLNGTIAADDAFSQTLATFANIEGVLDAVDATPRDLVRLLTFIVGAETLPAFYAARDEVYARWFPDQLYPGHSLAIVAGLAHPSLLLEMEGWSAAPAMMPR